VGERWIDEAGDVVGPPDAGEPVGPARPILVTACEAARLLALGRSTVYGLIAAGEIPTVHIGRSMRIAVADLEALVERLRQAQRL
jgi:excisionase family DNA binding protein